jgi:hypothetical protein
MTTPEAGDPNQFNETFQIPDGNDLVIPTIFNPPITALANRTQWNRARLLDPPLVPLFGAQQTEYTATTGPVPKRFTPWIISPGVGNFERGGWVQSDVTDGGGLWWWVKISPAVAVTMVAASIRGDDGPGANPGFPAAPDRPFMRLYRQSIDGSVAEPLTILADETASKAEYEAHHTLPQNPGLPFEVPLAFVDGEYLVIQFVGHKGANVAANTLKLYGIEITTALP